MRKLSLLVIVLLSLQSFAQKEIKKYVAANVNLVRTINPDSLDFSDFESIGNAIGDARIVMLGEQDHGDAPTFLAKTRLIKYLHEKKGFNVLAFEDDFFALEKGWQKTVDSNLDITAFLKSNITMLWASSKECENLFHSYIPNSLKTKTPLRVTGFDNQIYRSFSKLNLKNFIHEYLILEDIPFLKSSSYTNDFLSHVDFALTSTDLEKSKKFEAAIDIVLTQVLPKADDMSFEIMMLKNIKTVNKVAINRLSNINDHAIRDKQMAENLKWLTKYSYPNEKIIVWAHSAHIAKSSQLIEGNSSIKKSMASFFTFDEDLKRDTYIMGFTSKTGTAGRLTLKNKFSVQKPSGNDFEGWFPKELGYGFVDFKAFNLVEPEFYTPFKMKGIAHSSNFAPWNKVFDGIFYIRDMYPSEKIKN